MNVVLTEPRTWSATTGSCVVLGAGVLFSVGPILYRGVTVASPWQYLVYRALAVTVVASGQVWWRHRSDLAGLLRSISFRQVLAGLIMSSMFISFIVSLTYTDAASTLIVQSLAPFTAALAGWVLLRERLDRPTLIAMFVATLGVIVMVGRERSSTDLVGLAVAAVIPIGLGIYAAVVSTVEGEEPIVPAVVAGVTTLVVATTVATVQAGGVALPLRDAALGLTAGGLALGVGLPLFNLARAVVPAARATLLLLSEVVLGPVWVWIWPGERPSGSTLVGGAIIFAALVWLLTQPTSSTTEADRGPEP